MKCRACLGEHEPWLRCEVAAARTAINRPAINAVPINGIAINEEKSHVTPAVARPSTGASEISANGRKREVYNAYMRGYMRARRAGRVS